MILSFKCDATRALFAGESVPRFANLRSVAERKLQRLHRATCLDGLCVPPQNRLEKRRGDRAGSWSIRINDQWRLCFRFEGGNALDAEIVDYH
jgi:proteic killer suppression protein